MDNDALNDGSTMAIEKTSDEMIETIDSSRSAIHKITWPSTATLWRLVRRHLARRGVVHAAISIALVDDAAIRAINARHLGHDWPTDVISFPLSDAGRRGPVRRADHLVGDGRDDGARGWRGSLGRAVAVRGTRFAPSLWLRRQVPPRTRSVMRRREGEILARRGPDQYVSPGRTGPRRRHAGRESARWAV